MQSWCSELWHRGSMVQMISGREKINGRSCVHQLPLYHYWHQFDRSRVLVIWQRQMTVQEMEGMLGIPKTTIHHILTKYLMKKKVAVQWIPHMLLQNNVIWNCVRNIWLVQKGRNCVFATNNWSLDAWL